MNKIWITIIAALLITSCATSQTETAAVASNLAPQAAGQAAQKQFYETRADHDPDGIGKFYQGREISHVMGHAGADWLERPDREKTELPQNVVENMKLRPTDVVADVGAGTGYFSFRMSPLVKQGKVYAVDIQLEMLALIEARKKKLNADNVLTILGTEKDSTLPKDAIDVVLLVDAYHEFSYPREMMESIVNGLKPGGRVIQIEYRGEDPEVPIKPLHKMTVAQARKEMSEVGLVWKETKNFLPQQHFIVYEKPAK
jgi:ubiquinone/menaquinone biosynthesis C-methylase UbiE